MKGARANLKRRPCGSKVMAVRLSCRVAAILRSCVVRIFERPWRCHIGNIVLHGVIDNKNSARIAI